MNYAAFYQNLMNKFGTFSKKSSFLYFFSDFSKNMSFKHFINKKGINLFCKFMLRSFIVGYLRAYFTFSPNYISNDLKYVVMNYLSVPRFTKTYIHG